MWYNGMRCIETCIQKTWGSYEYRYTQDVVYIQIQDGCGGCDGLRRAGCGRAVGAVDSGAHHGSGTCGGSASRYKTGTGDSVSGCRKPRRRKPGYRKPCGDGTSGEAGCSQPGGALPGRRGTGRPWSRQLCGTDLRGALFPGVPVEFGDLRPLQPDALLGGRKTRRAGRPAAGNIQPVGPGPESRRSRHLDCAGVFRHSGDVLKRRRDGLGVEVQHQGHPGDDQRVPVL